MALTKRMRAMLAKKPESEAPLPLAEAMAVLKGFPPTKFDQTVEIHLRLGIDPKQADQIIRGSIVLPHGIGKSKRVVVFARGNLAEDANAAGAEHVGADDLAKKIKEGWTDFDVCIAAPDMMGLVGPLGKGRGQRSVECGSAHETIFNQLQLDFLLAKHLAKLRGLLSVELSKADDNHVANVIETALEVVNQHVLDEFAH